MIPLFGHQSLGAPAQAEAPAGYAEALLAGWVFPLPDPQVRTEAVALASDEGSDATAFLARVYLHQQC